MCSKRFLWHDTVARNPPAEAVLEQNGNSCTVNSTTQRDTAARLARSDPDKALQLAGTISDPWFRAQALAHVARHSPTDVVALADRSAQAASACVQLYQSCAVRAWEITALAERGEPIEAQARLLATVHRSRHITPSSSRSSALLLLLHAAARIDLPLAEQVGRQIIATSNQDSNWRCQRDVVAAVSVVGFLNRDAAHRLLAGVQNAKLRSRCDRSVAAGGRIPRSFFS